MGINKKGNYVIIGILILVIFLVAFIPLFAQLKEDARWSAYECQDEVYDVLYTTEKLCTNQSYSCLTAGLSIYNLTYDLCTNTSGVRVVNETPTSGLLLYNESSIPTGLSTGENALLTLIPILVIVGLILVVYMLTLGRKK